MEQNRLATDTTTTATTNRYDDNMNTEKMTVKMTFVEPLLGCASNNREIQAEFIASKAENLAQTQEEVLSISERIEKTMTVFPKDDAGLFLWDYQIRGFFKENLRALIEMGDCKVSKWQLKTVVNQFVRVNPRRIRLCDEKGANIMAATETLQRPLRASTLQGDRIALSSSQVLPPGTNITFDVALFSSSNAKSELNKLKMSDLRQCFEFAAGQGFLQWRSGGYGRFEWAVV